MAFSTHSPESTTKLLIEIFDFVKTKDVSATLERLNTLKQLGKLSELSHQVDEQGNNFLHLAVLHYDATDIKKYQEIIGDDATIEMHLVANNKGLTAMQMAETLPDEQKKKIHHLLLPTALAATKKCINDDPTPLDYNLILQKYNVKPDTKLANNLKLGCDVVNVCKKLGVKSSTHPRINELNQSEYKDIVDKVNQFRKALFQRGKISSANYIESLTTEKYYNCAESAFLAANYLRYQVKNNDGVELMIFHDRYIFAAINLQRNASLYSPVTWGPDARLVYAGEYKFCASTYWASDRVMPSIYIFDGKVANINDPDTWEYDLLVDCGQMKPDCSIETARISNGDHVFDILDRTLENNSDKPNSFGENAVFIDSWNYNVFPANHLENNLMDYYNILIDDRKYNFLCYFNPKYHRIKTFNTFNVISKFISFSDPDLQSDKTEKEKKEKLASIQQGKNAVAEDDAVKQDTDTESKFAKRATKPPLVLDNKNGLFDRFQTLEGLIIDVGLPPRQQKEKPSPLLFFTPEPASATTVAAVPASASALNTKRCKII